MNERTPGNNVLGWREAVETLVGELAGNPWFVDTFWPENEPRIRLMAQLALDRFPVPSRGLDIGCAFGHFSYLFRLLGYDITAVDTFDDAERTELFIRAGIRYHDANLNEVHSLAGLQSEGFDFILMGEVFEHILNHPAGLLESLFGLLRPGGLLILTTPNPSTLANAIRLVNDRYLLWGTSEFLNQTKLKDGKVIDRGDIHYREYPLWVVRDLMVDIGFEIGGARYVTFGSAPTHSFAKRSAKRFLRTVGLANRRLFSSAYVVWGDKPA